MRTQVVPLCGLRNEENWKGSARQADSKGWANSFKTRTLMPENQGVLVPSPLMMFICLIESYAEAHCASQGPLWSQAGQVIEAAAATGTKRAF